MLFNHSQGFQTFSSPRKKFSAYKTIICLYPASPVLVTSDLLSVSVDLPVSSYFMGVKSSNICSSVGLISLSTNVSKVHLCCGVCPNFIFMVKYLIVCIYQILFIHSFVNEHLDCLYLLTIVNSVAMNVDTESLF